MASTATLLVLSFLLIGSDLVSSKKYTADDLIDDVSPFIPGSRIVLKTALKAWKFYGKYKKMTGNSTDDLLEEIGDELNNIDREVKESLREIRHLSKDVQELKSSIMDNIEIDDSMKNDLISQLKEFDNLNGHIDHFYNDWLYYNSTNSQTTKKELSNSSHKIKDLSESSLRKSLNDIHDKLIKKNGAAGLSMLDSLTNNRLTDFLMCLKVASPGYQLNNLYQRAMKSYMKGMILIDFASNQLEKENQELGDGALNFLVTLLYRQMTEIVGSMKIFMTRASYAYWKCPTQGYSKDVTYATISPVFQTYFLKEDDAEDGISGCASTCEKRKDKTDIKAKCQSKFCKNYQTGQVCQGLLKDCGPSKDKMQICFADNDSERRYHYVKGNDANSNPEIYGKKSTCRKLVTANKAKEGFYPVRRTCEYCQCTCVNDGKFFTDRYFSLRNVTSDVDNNKVVTGVRFAKKNNIFHIQIEEGVLRENGFIEKNSTTWKKVDNFSLVGEGVFPDNDYHSIKWDTRTVHLDDLVSEGDVALTGLRLKAIDDKALQLEIQLTPFDFETGKLDTSNSVWITNSNDKRRTEIDLTERDLPRPNKYRYLSSEPNQFFKFTKSSFKDDLGQTVVPFIDLTDITTEIRTPLSGAGLVHLSNNPQSAGYLSFKLFNYNYAHHLEL